MGRDVVGRGVRVTSIDLVIPVFNEAATIDGNLRSILQTLDDAGVGVARAIVVDDGSADGTAEVVAKAAETEPRITLIAFTRNFGKESAIHAGLSHVEAEAVVVMDSDLQHPPDLIPLMVEAWRNGAMTVEAKKLNDGSDSPVRRIAASGFYALFHWLSGLDLKGQTDFKLLDAEVVRAYCALPERRRFFRGLVAWLGYPGESLEFEVPEREGGGSKWSYRRLVRLAFTVITGFSSSFLHLVNIAAGLSLALGVLFGGKALFDYATGAAVSGFTTVILLILIIGGIIMLSLGQIGLYLEHVFEEVKRRPSYVINRRESLGIGQMEKPAANHGQTGRGGSSSDAA